MPQRQHRPERATCSLLVYGSLMSAAERSACGIDTADAIPVIVSGYRREFSQEPSWRSGDGRRRGVLTVLPDTGCSINAILLTNLSADLLRIIDERERGYTRQRVRASRIAECHSARPMYRDAFIYEGKPGLQNDKLLAHPKYLQLCVEAAGSWGSDFERMFRETTVLAGRPLGTVHV